MTKKVKVEGQLVTRASHGGKDIEFFEEVFIIDGVKDIPEARMLIQRGLIQPRLERKIKNFHRVRKCDVVSIEDVDENAEDGEVSKLMLKALELNCVPLNINNYKRPDHKEKALKQAIEEAEKRLRKLEKKSKKVDSVEDHGYID